jgi:hypothetical protein
MNAHFLSERHEATETGYQSVHTPVSCLLTRFQVKSVWSLIRLYLWYRRVRHEARTVSGLLKTVFLVENLRTCYTLSIWESGKAILEFNTKILTHVDAANSSFRELTLDGGRPQLWSAQFRLSAVSPHNLRWNGLDLAPFVRVSEPGCAGSEINAGQAA